MRSPFYYFRKHQKLLLAVFGVALMIVFTVGSIAIRWLDTGGRDGANDETAVTFKGGSLNQQQLDGLRQRHNLVMAYLRTLMDESRRNGGNPGAGMIRPGDSDRDLLQTYLLAQKAGELGIVISDDAIIGFLQELTDNKVPTPRFGTILKRLFKGKMNEKFLFEVLAEELAAKSLEDIVISGHVAQTPGQPIEFVLEPSRTWDYFTRLNRELTAEMIPVSVADFVEEVPQPSDEQIAEFFNRYKEKFSFPDDPKPGFKQRRKIAVSYVRGNFQDFLDEEKAKVTNEEIEAYYNEHRSDYTKTRLPDEEDVSPEESDQKEDGKSEGNETESGKAAAGESAADDEPEAGDAAAKGDETTGGTAPPPPANDGDGAAPEEAATPAAGDGSSLLLAPGTTGGTLLVKFDETAESPAGTGEPAGDVAESNASAPAAEVGDDAADGAAPTGDAAAGDASQETADIPAGEGEPGEGEPGEGEPGEGEPGEGEPAEGKPAGVTPDTAPEGPADDKGAEKAGAEPDQKKPGDTAAGADGNQTGDSAAETDSQPAGEPAGEPAAEAAAAPSAESPVGETDNSSGGPGVEPAPEPEYRPLEEVRDQILRGIAAEPAQKRFDLALDTVKAVMDEYYDERAHWEALRTEQPDAPEPQPPDIAALAKEHGLTLGATPGEVDYLEFEQLEIGKATDVSYRRFTLPNGMPRIEPVTARLADEAFTEGLPLYQAKRFPGRTRGDNLFLGGSREIQYVYWKTAETEEQVPELKDVRPSVVETWKLREAVELARQAADKMADQARQSGLTLVSEFGKEKVIETDAFTFYDLASVSAAREGQGRMTVSQIPGVDGVGKDFMKSVFDLSAGDVGVALNQPQTKLYVVRVKTDEPSAEDLRKSFLTRLTFGAQAGLPQEFNMMAFDSLMEYRATWLDDFEKEMEVVWKRDPRPATRQEI